LRATLAVLPAVKAKLAGRNALLTAELETAIELLPELRSKLEAAIVDEPPLALKDGGLIRPGYDADLDELRELALGGKQWMANYQKTESERLKTNSLKVGFNKVFGYYLELSNSARVEVPASYQRKQTVKNAERYVTPELKEYEQKVLTAEERAKALEYDVFCRLRDAAAACTTPLQRSADALATLDALLGLAETAAARQYCRPVVTDGPELTIVGGRHPVLDKMLPAGKFVPNDTRLGGDDGRFLLITGPNMAGKSTYIRQVSLITLLAQIGSFVPAESATIGVADRIFTRVGASDELGRGQSTFMVEMTETANILNNATSRSLVVLDEIGRGTSTYDGVSLAWAISEDLHDRVGCRTLFATHYHELIDLEKTMTGLRNRNVAVREWKDEVVFLHQIVDGGADRSYGIHVARLAGIPNDVLNRSEEILQQLERDPFGKTPGGPSGDGGEAGRPKKHRRQWHQLSLFPTGGGHPVLDELRLLDAAGLTPDAALAKLNELRERLTRDE
ncbi:MAG: DNA mismatch repair protein MutS, partial [Planctomycetia bacterium]